MFMDDCGAHSWVSNINMNMVCSCVCVVKSECTHTTDVACQTPYATAILSPAQRAYCTSSQVCKGEALPAQPYGVK